MYRKYGRFNVFSHEELMMKMVSKVDDLQLDVAESLLVDLNVSKTATMLSQVSINNTYNEQSDHHIDLIRNIDHC